ncbi:putative ph-response regulator protein pali rim9 protein [Botrytis fragariae]|uniref:Putative ph-response regulator protein pali rim9 protein n=1 Tax=Botrytis fragariae TaxID=1964551 RepID=A0A8H6B3R6_9HELO|nr:putative ph-response regulator protein pali rim9 protein [Botrytis fragariae]KAF5878585.1 putative ph-response regulator protein pali rim9 protein [Botrytis fragariae]
MLRPATPLSLLLLAAFACLLVSILSTPIIKSIPLASFDGVQFGVFGFCKGSTCSNIEIGYSTESLYDETQSATFDLSTSTRSTLSAILIIHPVAALFTLIMLILAIAAHFHAPSHSPRYLLGIFILSILTLILTLLAFLIDVLLFVPHMAWGSYVVLAATVIIAASGVVSCAMRRTLVSRKARKRRIEENAEMNGENFYNRQETETITPVVTDTSISKNPANEKLPTFATFDASNNERTSDERIPLTTRTPTTENSPTNVPGGSIRSQGMDGYNGPQSGTPSIDQYGNPIPMMPMMPQVGSAYGMRNRDQSAGPPGQALSHQYSNTSMNSRGRGGMPPGPPGRGGYGPPRGGYRGGYGGPPPGPNRGGYGYGQPRGGGGMNNGMMAMGNGGRAPPPGYDSRGPSDPSAPIGGFRDASPAPPGGYIAYRPDEIRPSSLPRAESPPPMEDLENVGMVGQAIEMDATTGSPSHPPPGFVGQFGNLRDSDDDVAGMVGLQQQKIQQRHETLISETSQYSQDEYVPPRQVWGQQAGRSSPLNPASQPVVELPPSESTHKRDNSNDTYYEDVDPRFADPAPAPATKSSLTIPAALNIAAQSSNNNYDPNSHLHPNPLSNLDGNNSYNSLEELQSGQRSPAESERSTFTSVSQRGINPRWNGGASGYAGPPMPNRRPAARREDVLLNDNPDFALPIGRGGRGPPRVMRGGMIPNSAYPGASAL